MNNKKDYQEYIKELGQKIKTYRIMKEMSQQDLEDKTGVCSLKLFDNSINL